MARDPKKSSRAGPAQIIAAVVIALGAIIAALIISGSRQQSSTSAAAPRSHAPAVAAAASTVSAPPACVSDAKDISHALRALQSRLDVGVNVGEYTRLVGDARVAFDERDQQPGPCDAAFEQFDTAITIHSDAASEWQMCIEDYPNCFVDTVGLPKSQGGGVRLFRLYKRWDSAEKSSKQGDGALDAVQ